MIKTIHDYIPQLCEIFPNICKEDIKRMAEYGWRMFYYYNLRGNDTLIESSKYKYWFYCGHLCIDPIKHFHYYISKLSTKLRTLYCKRKIKWDGYYYMGIDEQEYNKLVNKKGRPRKYWTYTNRVAYKVFDEAKIKYSAYKCIIRFKYVTDMGMSFYKEKLKCQEVEPVLVRDHPDKFVDILITNYDYKTL